MPPGHSPSSPGPAPEPIRPLPDEVFELFQRRADPQNEKQKELLDRWNTPNRRRHTTQRRAAITKLNEDAQELGLEPWICFGPRPDQRLRTLADRLTSVQAPEEALRAFAEVACDCHNELAHEPSGESIKPTVSAPESDAKAKPQPSRVTQVAYLWNDATQRIELLYQDGLLFPCVVDGLIAATSVPGQQMLRRDPAPSFYRLDLPPSPPPTDRAQSRQRSPYPFMLREKIARTYVFKARCGDAPLLLFLGFREDDPRPAEEVWAPFEQSMQPPADLLAGWLARRGAPSARDPVLVRNRTMALTAVHTALKSDYIGAAESLADAVKAVIPQQNRSVAVHWVLPVSENHSEGLPTHFHGGRIWVEEATKKVYSKDGQGKLTVEDVPEEWRPQINEKFVVQFHQGEHVHPVKPGAMVPNCKPIKSMSTDVTSGLVATGLSVQAAVWGSPIFFPDLRSAKSTNDSVAQLSEPCRYTTQAAWDTACELAMPIRYLPPWGMPRNYETPAVGVIDVEYRDMLKKDEDAARRLVLSVDALSRLYSAFDFLRWYRDVEDANIVPIRNWCCELLHEEGRPETGREAYQKLLDWLYNNHGTIPAFQHLAFASVLLPDWRPGPPRLLPGGLAVPDVPDGVPYHFRPLRQSTLAAHVLSGDTHRAVRNDAMEVAREADVPEAPGLDRICAYQIRSHLLPRPHGVFMLGWTKESSPDPDHLDKVVLPMLNAIASLDAFMMLGKEPPTSESCDR